MSPKTMIAWLASGGMPPIDDEENDPFAGIDVKATIDAWPTGMSGDLLDLLVLISYIFLQEV